MNTDSWPNVPFMSGITRESEYALMLENQKGADFASSPDGKTLVSEVVKRLVRRGGGYSLQYKQELFLDTEDLDYVASEELCMCAAEGLELENGIPDENWEAQAMLHHDGHQCEVMVQLWPGGK